MRKREYVLWTITLCFIMLLSAIFAYNERSKRADNEIKVVNMGRCAFRGALIDGVWHNPEEITTNAGEWVLEPERHILYVDQTGSELLLKLPYGNITELTFDVGPEEGSVNVIGPEDNIEINLFESENIPDGKGYNVSSIFGASSSRVNSNKVFVVFISILFLYMILFIVAERLLQKEVFREHKTTRNDAVEFLRFIVASCVCFHHYGYCNSGYLGVDFFFLLSGYLLMRKHRDQKKECESPATAAWKYSIRRYKSLIPYYLFAFLFAISCEYIMGVGRTLGDLLSDNVFELMMVAGFGLTDRLAVGPGWYCSALVIAGFLVFYLLKKNEEIFIKIIIPIATGVFFAVMSTSFGCLNRWTQCDLLIWTGTIRGFVELGLGCCAFYLLDKYKLFPKKRWVDSLIQFFCVAYIGYVFFFCRESRADFFCVATMMILLMTLFAEDGILYTLLNNRCGHILGNVSVMLYFLHMTTRNVDFTALLGVSGYKACLVWWISTILLSIVSYRYIELLSRMYERRRHEKTKQQ